MAQSLLTPLPEFDQQFPLNPRIDAAWSLPQKDEFARQFVAARDVVEAVYYTEADRNTTAGARTRKFLGALFNPIIGRPVKDAEHFYETFGRLMRQAWLSVSVGIYDDAIRAIPEAATRLHTSQVNTIDLAWRPTASTIPDDGLIVEVGTGRGNSVARLAQLFPQARIVTITISPEQKTIAEQVIAQMGITNVEIRQGDIFDPAVTDDLVGQADAVGVIEVTGHFPHEHKAEGIGMFARMLKPGATLSLLDSALRQPLNKFLENFYTNQSWYFGTREGYFTAFDAAGVTPVSYLKHSDNVLDTFTDTTTVLRRYRADLRRDFGAIMGLFWPELPGTVYLSTIKQIDYVQIVGVKD
ncbi:MAG: class I SAM-dependent methyltransferase [Anaerolineaceae bacterium]|nr:class I SAM-dependent methyltransferase [Anaerolineaceae bacterium]